MVLKARKTTLNQNRLQHSGLGAGFTLIEILIVLAIITMIMALGLPAIERVTYQRVNSTTRKFVGIIRNIRNDSILLSSVYRLALDLEKKTWWVETQKQFKLLSEAPEEPTKESNKKKGPNSNFALADKYTKKPEEMPSGVVFKGVLKEREGLRKEGVVYIHFFPNGYVEQSILYVAKDGSEHAAYSLIVRPTGGRVDILPDEVTRFD